MEMQVPQLINLRESHVNLKYMDDSPTHVPPVVSKYSYSQDYSQPLNVRIFILDTGLLLGIGLILGIGYLCNIPTRVCMHTYVHLCT